MDKTRQGKIKGRIAQALESNNEMKKTGIHTIALTLVALFVSPWSLEAQDPALRASSHPKTTIACNLGAIASRTLPRFWTVSSRSAPSLEFLAAHPERKGKLSEAPGRQSLNVDMMLGGLTTTTAPHRKENGELLLRDAGHILANRDKAFCDLATQRKDTQGKPKFVMVNGSSIPDCTDYYLGKDKNGIGGAGVGGDPQVDNIDSPFLQYYECYKWNGTAYVYDWTPLERRLDAALTLGPISYFIPGIPWAFQRGMTFCGKDDPRAIRRIPNGWFQYTGTIYPDVMRETRYGNEMVPDRLEDYGKFLEAAVRHLATSPKYKDLVPNWSWKIGQEVDTRAYTMERYFNLYQVSLQAILQVLPNARIGVHIGVAHEKGWIPLFLKHCRQNNLKCDFVGISRYRILNQPNADPQGIEEWLQSLTKAPAWLPGTALEIHESGIDAGPAAVDKEVQQMPYYALFASHLLQNPPFEEWFKGTCASTACLEWMETVVGQPIYECKIPDKPGLRNAWVGAIVTRNPVGGELSVLVYNYNADSGESSVENVQLHLTGMPSFKTYQLESKTFRYDKLVDQKQLPAERVTSEGELNVEISLAANSILTLTIQPPAGREKGELK
jgi:hypothetical protein